MGVNYAGWGCVCYRCMGAGVIRTYIGVEAVIQHISTPEDGHINVRNM